jgi:hypothetical protein
MRSFAGGLWKEMAWNLHYVRRQACPAVKSGIQSATSFILSIANHALATDAASALIRLQTVDVF